MVYVPPLTGLSRLGGRDPINMSLLPELDACSAVGTALYCEAVMG